MPALLALDTTLVRARQEVEDQRRSRRRRAERDNLLYLADVLMGRPARRRRVARQQAADRLKMDRMRDKVVGIQGALKMIKIKGAKGGAIGLESERSVPKGLELLPRHATRSACSAAMRRFVHGASVVVLRRASR